MTLDLKKNHNRTITRAYVQTRADAVAAVAMSFGGAVELSGATERPSGNNRDWR